MTLKVSVAVANAHLDSVETTVGTSPRLQIWTGAPPANCAASATGSKLAEIVLPSDWMAAASGGSKGKAGTWSGSGIAAGTAGYFRITDSAVAVCHLQGTITATGGGGDATMDNTSIAVSQALAIAVFTLTDGDL